jgi:hypothetical protein
MLRKSKFLNFIQVNMVYWQEKCELAVHVHATISETHGTKRSYTKDKTDMC